MRKGFLKKLAAVVLTVVCTAGLSVPALAAGWKQDNKGWWYETEDGGYLANTWWQDQDGMWYVFDQNGYIYTNTYRMIDGVLYPFLSNGMWAGTAFADYGQGVWTGNTYANPWSGVSITVPEGAVFSYDLDAIMLSGSFIQEFMLTLPGGLDGQITLTYHDINAYPEITDGQYTSIAAISLAEAGLQITGSHQVKLNGKVYTKVSSTISGAIFADCYFRRVGHYMEIFLTSYSLGDKAAIDSVMATIR